MAKPKFVSDEHLEYLDGLRESGVTNMFGAGSYLSAAFGMSKKNASEVLMYWMETFTQRHPN